MVNYQKNKKELSMYLREMIKIICKPQIILAIIFTPLAVFLLAVGYLDDEEALTMGYSSLALAFFCIYLIIRYTLIFKKIMNKWFEDADENGALNFSIEIVNNNIVLKCINTGTISLLKKKDIKKVILTNKIIFAKTTLGQYFTFPKNKEIEQLIR